MESGNPYFRLLTCQLARDDKFSTINLYSVLYGAPYLPDMQKQHNNDPTSIQRGC